MNPNSPKDPNLYRSGVGIIMLNKNGEVFVGQRFDFPSDAWQMPQGGIDSGEETEEAMLRELLEEVGTNNVSIITRNKDWLYYDLPPELQQKLWGGRFLGQKQIWFVVKFLGDDSEVNINTHRPEFSDWKWVDVQQLPSLIVNFKRKLYEQLLIEFKEHLS